MQMTGQTIGQTMVEGELITCTRRASPRSMPATIARASRRDWRMEALKEGRGMGKERDTVTLNAVVTSTGVVPPAGAEVVPPPVAWVAGVPVVVDNNRPEVVPPLVAWLAGVAVAVARKVVVDGWRNCGAQAGGVLQGRARRRVSLMPAQWVLNR